MKIIALCGKKQSGKTTLSNLLHGHEMKRHDVVQDFSINEFGSLVVNYVEFDDKGKEKEGTAIFDLWQQNQEFAGYAQRFIWPLIKGYNFADALKEICMNLFNLSYEQLYGTDSWKNSPTDFNWENMPGWTSDPACPVGNYYHKPGPMTAREFMQYFGTDIMRKINKNVWIDNCIKRINHDQPPIAIISDCRFTNEIEAVKAVGGKVINLTRDPYSGDHSSESDLDSYSNFDGVIDNKNMTIQESCSAFLDMAVDMGITQHIRTINPRLGTASVK
jgi:hypothetical protein